jgi:hypothetical protein
MYGQKDNLYSGGRQHVSQLKVTCLQACSATGFSTILLCCESCQAVQVHKRYRNSLRLCRQGFDFTEYIAFQNYTGDGTEMALRDEIYRKPDNEASIGFRNFCALVSFDACVSQRKFYCITTWMTGGERGMLIGQK